MLTLTANTLLPQSSLAATSDTFGITRALPIDGIDRKGHKLELKSNRTYLTNRIKFKSWH